MDFSASTDLHDNDDTSNHIIVPRSTRGYVKSPLAIETNHNIYSPVYHKSNKPSFSDEEYSRLNIPNFKAKIKEATKKPDLYRQKLYNNICKEPGPLRIKYKKIIENLEAPTVQKNLFFDNEIFIQLKKKDFRSIKWSNYHNRCQTASNPEEAYDSDYRN